MFFTIALAVSLAFQVVTPPADAPPHPGSFQLAGYTCTVDAFVPSPENCKAKDEIIFSPETGTMHAFAFVSYVAPLSGRCGVGRWEVGDDGKSSFDLSDVAEVKKGEPVFQHVVFHDKDEYANTSWGKLPTIGTSYGLVVICAITEGAGSGKESTRASSFYRVDLPTKT